jgi:hypothetical protein
MGAHHLAATAQCKDNIKMHLIKISNDDFKWLRGGHSWLINVTIANTFNCSTKQ